MTWETILKTKWKPNDYILLVNMFRHMADKSPVVRCIYTSGSIKKFMYMRRNSNNEERVE